MLQDADFTGAGLPARVFVDLAHRHPNFLFAKLEVLLPGQKCAEIVEQTAGQVQIIYGLGGVAMLDGLAHGASAMMPGAACLEVYVRVYELYLKGQRQEAKALFYRLIPYLTFALQHLEIAVHIEKLVLVKRGILPSARMRRPTVHVDSTMRRKCGSWRMTPQLYRSNVAPAAPFRRDGECRGSNRTSAFVRLS
jgi:4-hydroxy-tetrahydrodipicolinate synthase